MYMYIVFICICGETGTVPASNQRFVQALTFDTCVRYENPIILYLTFKRFIYCQLQLFLHLDGYEYVQLCGAKN